MSERNAYDFYATPPALAQACVHELVSAPRPVRIIDAGAGSGIWGQSARHRWPDATITGVDLRDIPQPAGYDEWHAATNFLDFQDTQHNGWSGSYNLVLMNPPYSCAEAFVNHGLRFLHRHGGQLGALLRLSFLGSQKRLPFWQRRGGMLAGIYPIAPRPSFTGEGSDNSEYAFFLWRYGSATPFKWINWKEPRSIATQVEQGVLL